MSILRQRASAGSGLVCQPLILCLQAEQSTVESLRQQVQAQEGQLPAAQEELAKAKQALDAKAKAVKFLSEQKGKLWPALVAGTALESVAYKQAGNKQVTEAVEKHQANMARLRALEASSAVRHWINSDGVTDKARIVLQCKKQLYR